MTFLELATAIDTVKAKVREAEDQVLKAELAVDELKIRQTEELRKLEQVVDEKTKVHQDDLRGLRNLYNELQKLLAEAGFSASGQERSQVDPSSKELKDLFLKGQKLRSNLS